MGGPTSRAHRIDGQDRGHENEKGVAMQDLKLFSGNANAALARAVARYLDVELGRAEVGSFSDGECAVEIGENVRGLDSIILQSTSPDANFGRK